MNVYKTCLEKVSVDLQNPMLEVRNTIKGEVTLYSNNKKAVNAIILLKLKYLV